MSTRLFQSLMNVNRHTEPWEYFTFGQCLSPDQIQEIKTADIDRASVLNDGTRSGYIDGVGKQNDKFREYVTKKNWLKYPELTNFIKELQSKPIREMIAKMVGNKDNFANSYVRLEVIADLDGFWLEPHCDIKEKLMSSILFVNRYGENENLGTDFYTPDLKLKHTVPFWHNFGYIFHGPNKWHGMEKGKTIRTERRGIQINYVTFETDWKVE